MRSHRIVAAAILLVTALLGVALLPDTAGAEVHAGLTLESTSDTGSWSGTFHLGAVGVWPARSLPDGCTPELCDTVPVHVQLPDNPWQQRPGGMLVAIRTTMPNDSEVFGAQDLDLYVYGPEGTVVASGGIPGTLGSTSTFSDETAWIPNPVNGTYRVVVVPKLVASQPVVEDVLDPVTYDGFIRFQRGLTIHREETNAGQTYVRQIVAFGLAKQRPVTELLPDLVPTTPRNFHLETTAGVPPLFYIDRGLRHPPSCYPQETLGLTEDNPEPSEDGPDRCLRFDLGEHNVGDGPFQLNVYDVNGPLTPGGYEIYQRIYTSEGQTVRQRRLPGAVEFSDQHNHFHYVGFQEVTLHRIQPDGTLAFVKKKPDKGVCMGDFEMSAFGRTDRPLAPSGYVEGCLAFTHRDASDPTFPGQEFFEMGISVGWADVYQWYLSDQYIDVSEVPAGDYAVVVRQDVSQLIQEKSLHNNTAVGCVRLTMDAALDISCPPQAHP